MQIGLLGINHTSAISLREELAKACQEIVFNDAHVLLSTCNRTEIYFSSGDLERSLDELQKCIQSSFEDALYSYFGIDCFYHLAKVTAGLDSSIYGESEIQRQVKNAYQQTSSLTSALHYLFQKSLKIGKLIRTRFPLFHRNAHFERVIFDLSTFFFKDLNEISLLFIGNSEINRRIIHYLSQKNVREMTLCTRTLENAKELQKKYGLRLCDWKELPKWSEYDLIVSGTTRCDYLIRAEDQEGSLKNQLIFDLSIPRNIDPLLGQRPYLTLFNIDQIAQLVDKQQRLQKQELSLCNALLKEEVSKLYAIFEKKQEGLECAIS